MKTNDRQQKPSTEDLKNPNFDIIWNVIRSWQFDEYEGATGNHVVELMNALKLNTKQ